MCVFRAIAEHQLDAGPLSAASALELPAFHGTAQLEHVCGRLGEIDVHRVDLLHHGQGGRFALAHQGAFRDQCATDAAGDGGGHAGVAEVDVGGAHCGLGSCHVGLGLFFGRFGVHKVLFADGVGGDQWAIAFCLCAGLRQIGLCLGEAGACTFCRCCVGSGINAEQHLPRLNVAAFLEHPLLEDACGPGAHLGHARCLHAARQLGDQAYIARGGGDHAHLDGRGLGATRTGGLSIGLAAGGYQQYRCADGGQRKHSSGGGGTQLRGAGCVMQLGHGSPLDVRQKRERAIRPGRAQGAAREVPPV